MPGMKDLCIDFETTTYNKGSPFDNRNQIVCIAYCDTSGGREVIRPHKNALDSLQKRISESDRIVGFNLKFDLHWLRKAGIDFSSKRVYDAQAAEFVLSGQSHKFPSLNDVSEKYLGRRKIDEVAALWDQGVQTTDIPWETLAAYAAEDVDLTLSVAREQEARTPLFLKNLISLVNQDLLVLEEMEWNGIKFDRAKAVDKANEIELKIAELQWKHSLIHNVPNFNWASNDHLSALLYGGTITETVKVPVGHYKSGAKAGQVKYKNEEREHKLPRIFKPLKGSETAKGTFSVEEAVLLSLEKGNQELLKDLLTIKKYKKELSTYLYGLQNKQDEGHYSDYIYGQFNQCVAATGRLSSSNPNLQNLSEEAGKCLVSRY